MNYRKADKSPALEDVKIQFESWRSNRGNKREPIPHHLWQAAAGLCRQHSIAQVSRELRLSYTDLKKKRKGDMLFIEEKRGHALYCLQ